MIALIGVIPSYLVGITSFRYAIILAVLISIFMSRGFGLTLSEEGMPITYTRMIYPLILIVVLPAMVSQVRNFKLNQFGIGLLHCIVVALSTILAGRMPALVYIFDWFLSSYLFVLAGVIFFKSGGNNKTISHFVMISVAVLFILAILEFLSSTPIVVTMMNVGLVEFGTLNEKILQGRFRDEGLRLQIFADNPLRLAQYANLLYVFVISNFASRSRVTKLLLAVMLFTIVYLTSSRSGIALFLIITFFAIFRGTPRVRQRFAAAALYFLLVIVIGVVVINGFQLVGNYMSNYSDVKLYEQTSEVRSSMERSIQLLWTLQEWLKSPVFGHGFLPNAGENLQEVNSLDSYLLRTLLEGGALGFLLFISFVLRYARFAICNIVNDAAFGYLAIVIALFWGAIFEYTIETFMVSFFFLGYFETKMHYEMRQRVWDGIR